MWELCFEMGKIILEILLAVGNIFGGLVFSLILAGWVWDKIQRFFDER